MKKFSHIFGYVTQVSIISTYHNIIKDDILLPRLTVKEILTFTGLKF